MRRKSHAEIASIILDEGYAAKVAQIGATIDPTVDKSRMKAYYDLLALAKDFYKKHGVKEEGTNILSALYPGNILPSWIDEPQKSLVRMFAHSTSVYLQPIKRFISEVFNARKAKDPFVENAMIIASGPMLTKIYQRSTNANIRDLVQQEIVDASPEELKVLDNALEKHIRGFKIDASIPKRLASLSRVVFGTYNGNEAALKTLRPRQIWFFLLETLFVDEMFGGSDPDILVLRAFAIAEIGAVVSEFAFEQEVENAKWAASTYGTIPHVRVPAVFAYGMAPIPFMLMERAVGKDLATVAKEIGYISGKRPGQTMIDLTVMWIDRLFREGKAHGDLHAGNLILAPPGGDTDFYVIDHGAIAYFNEKTLRLVARFYGSTMSYLLKSPFMESLLEDAGVGLRIIMRLYLSFFPDVTLKQLGNLGYEMCEISAPFPSDEELKKAEEKVRKASTFLDVADIIFSGEGPFREALNTVNACYFNSLNRVLTAFANLSNTFIILMNLVSMDAEREFQAIFQRRDVKFLLLNVLYRAVAPISIGRVPVFQQPLDVFLLRIFDDLQHDIRTYLEAKDLDPSARRNLVMAQVALTGLRTVGVQAILRDWGTHSWIAIIAEAIVDTIALATKISLTKKNANRKNKEEREKILKRIKWFTIRQGIVTFYKLLPRQYFFTQ